MPHLKSIPAPILEPEIPPVPFAGFGKVSVRRTRTRTGTPFEAHKRVQTPVFEGNRERGEVPTPAYSPASAFLSFSARHGSQRSNRAVGGQTPALPLNPAKCAVSQPLVPSVRLLPMKENLKSIGGSILIVALTLLILKQAKPYLPAFLAELV